MAVLLLDSTILINITTRYINIEYAIIPKPSVSYPSGRRTTLQMSPYTSERPITILSPSIWLFFKKTPGFLLLCQPL
jgi:hypothetical protein